MFGFFLNFFCYAVSAENKHAACWDLLKRFHKNHALAAQLIDHHRVMDNLMPYIDRRAETRERATISIARSTPAQKPRGCASRTSGSVEENSGMAITHLENGDDVYFKNQPLAGERVFRHAEPLFRP